MSVRERCRKDKDGKMQSSWWVDIKQVRPGEKATRIQKPSPVNTRRGAEQFERQIRQQLLDGTWGKVTLKAPTLAEFEAEFMDWSRINNKPSTVKHKEWAFNNHLTPVFGQLALDEITTGRIEAFKAAALWDEKANPKGRLSRKAVNNVLAVLAKTLRLAVSLGKLEGKIPEVKHLKLGIQTFQFLDFDETPLFLNNVAPEFRAMATIAVLTGLRRGELLGLKWSDVDLKTRKLMVRRNVSIWGDEGTPKNGKEREITLSAFAVETLKAHRSRNVTSASTTVVVPISNGGYVFTNASGDRLSHNGTRNVIETACNAAGLTKALTWHDLRHTFASHLVMRGVPLSAVQALLGHATISMTERYSHLSPNVKADAVQLLDQAFVNIRPAVGLAAPKGDPDVTRSTANGNPATNSAG